MASKLDLKELQEVYNKREIAKIPGFMYAEFVEEIVILRLADVPYRIIAERLNAKVKSRKIEPQRLRQLYLKWIEIQFINQEMIDRLKTIADNIKSNKYDDEEVSSSNVAPSLPEKSNEQWTNI
jgi:hypothetical protein